VGSLRGINFGLYALLSLLAWLVARRDHTHGRFAGYVTWMAVGNALRIALLDARDGAPKPYTGVARFLFHVDQALVLSWSAFFVALCIHHFAARRIWPAFVGWAAAMAVCLDYPAVSKDTLAALYRAAALITLLASWGCIAWGILRRRSFEPRLTHLTLILFATTDVALFLVPYARGLVANWPLVQLATVLMLASCCAVHLWWLRRWDETAEMSA
jgi:hypothetical protein